MTDLEAGANGRIYLARDLNGRDFVTDVGSTFATGDTLLLCDPLTRLLAYDSFEWCASKLIGDNPHLPIFLAIGDVDDLRGYVTSENAVGARSFGHLAGNRCMSEIGKITLQWELEHRDRYVELITGTFGGDEVIVCAMGSNRQTFSNNLTALRDIIRTKAPRPCSFAWSGTSVDRTHDFTSDDVYLEVVSAIDRSLFMYKAKARQCGRLINAAVLEVAAPDAVADAVV